MGVDTYKICVILAKMLKNTLICYELALSIFRAFSPAMGDTLNELLTFLQFLNIFFFNFDNDNEIMISKIQ